jgi:hypothetical protein
MAICNICNEFYIQKKCPNCYKEKSIKKKEKIIYREYGRFETKKDNTKKKYLIFMIPIIIILFSIYNINESNPLIGKWKPITKTIFSTGNIEFTKDKMYFGGIVTNAKYEIEENKVIIIDDMGIGVIYNIIDKNTISENMLGLGKVIYKRIE